MRSDPTAHTTSNFDTIHTNISSGPCGSVGSVRACGALGRGLHAPPQIRQVQSLQCTLPQQTSKLLTHASQNVTPQPTHTCSSKYSGASCGLTSAKTLHSTHALRSSRRRLRLILSAASSAACRVITTSASFAFISFSSTRAASAACGTGLEAEEGSTAAAHLFDPRARIQLGALLYRIGLAASASAVQEAQARSTAARTRAIMKLGTAVPNRGRVD